LVMEAGAIGQGGEIFVLDMGEPIKILDLAKEMIRLSGFEPDKDIAITFIGPRPGEKIFEEVLTAEEGTLVTKYKKILIAKQSQKVREDLFEKIGKLKEVIDKEDKEEILKIFKELIPTFTLSKNE